LSLGQRHQTDPIRIGPKTDKASNVNSSELVYFR